MLILDTLSDSQLHRTTQALVTQERKLTTKILWHLHEIQKRRLYAEQGHASLFEYAVQALGYSEAAAGRRIAAMRLLVEVPEMEEALKTGSVNLSTLCTAHHFSKNQEAPVTREEKRNVLQSLEGKSRRQCEQTLAAMSPQSILPRDRERVITPELTEIRFVADEALMEKLQRLRELDAHVNPDPSYLELFHRIADMALKALNPSLKGLRKRPPQTRSDTPSAQKESPLSTPPEESTSGDSRSGDAQLAELLSVKQDSSKFEKPPLSEAAIKRAVWHRDQGRCTYVSPEGKACGSCFALEYDHIHPVALGGKTTPENLRVRCRTHNQLAAIQVFGRKQMGRYLKA